MDTLVVTGHRPDKLGGYGWDNFSRLVCFAMDVIREQKPECVISGMAMGWDMATAIATIKLRDEEHLNIRLACTLPFSSQYTVWRDQRPVFLYTKILCKADVMYSLHRGAPANKRQAVELLDERNRHMIEIGDTVMALWNGTSGGTRNAVMYAKELNVPVINVWDRWLSFQR